MKASIRNTKYKQLFCTIFSTFTSSLDDTSSLYTISNINPTFKKMNYISIVNFPRYKSEKKTSQESRGKESPKVIFIKKKLKSLIFFISENQITML